MDVELSGITPAPDKGRVQWVRELHHLALALRGRRRLLPGRVDVDLRDRQRRFDPDTYEWTYEPETSSLGNAPRGGCLKSGGCTQFFGGQTRSSPFALMWQWSGGGGVRNVVGDFDQIDGARRAAPPRGRRP